MKVTTLIAISALVLLFFSTSCYARTQEGAYSVLGAGNTSCGQMTEDVKNYPRQAPEAFKSYIDGFISGYNLGRVGKSNYVERTDKISRYKFVLKHCEENPLDDVTRGVIKLILKTNDTIW